MLCAHLLLLLLCGHKCRQKIINLFKLNTAVFVMNRQSRTEPSSGFMRRSVAGSHRVTCDGLAEIKKPAPETGAGIGKTMAAVKNRRILEVTQSSRCISPPGARPFLQEAFRPERTG
jgi:hypothetical protein